MVLSALTLNHSNFNSLANQTSLSPTTLLPQLSISNLPIADSLIDFNPGNYVPQSTNNISDNLVTSSTEPKLGNLITGFN